MARPRSTDRPRTQWTDSNGRVLDEYGLSAFCINAIKDAKAAGVPVVLLHSSGWNGDENNVQGLFAHYVYTMADFLSSLERDIDVVEHDVLTPLAALCRSVDVDYRAAMAGIFDAARLLRQLRDHREGRPLPSEDIAAMKDAWDSVVVDEWGHPSGHDHDNHGHGLANGHWTCLTEEIQNDY